MTGLAVVPLWGMNFGPPGKDGHGRDDLSNEVRALCTGPRKGSKSGFVTEGKGWHPLPPVREQQVIHRTENASVANVGLYLAAGLDVLRVVYRQHEEGWSKVEHEGRHEPRATLTVLARGSEGHRTLFVSTHGPDPRADNPKAKTEWVDVMVDIIQGSPDPVIMGGDPNGLFDDVLRKLNNPNVIVRGVGADAILVRGYIITAADKTSSYNGVRFTNDHHGALVGRVVRCKEN